MAPLTPFEQMKMEAIIAAWHIAQALQQEADRK